MTREEYLQAVTELNTNDKRLVFTQKHLFHGIPHVFKDREEEYFEFRNRIANNYNIGFHEVFIVGSAKLGFSPQKGTEFSYESDIDVVLVNEKLFEDFYLKISEYQYQLDIQYKTMDAREVRNYNYFLQYLVKGWMRPDKLPTSFQVDVLKTQWFDFFKSISYNKSEVGNYKVAAGLFKNYGYLEKYYTRNIENLYESQTI